MAAGQVPPCAVTNPLTPARVATALAFGTQGLVFISLTTRLPRAQDRWDLGELGLAAVLLMMVLLAGVGSVLAEIGAKRTDSATVLRSGFLLRRDRRPRAGPVPHLRRLRGGDGVVRRRVGGGRRRNEHAGVSRSEHRYGRPVLPSLHGAWTLGGVFGAGLALATAHLPWEWGAPLGLLPLRGVAAPYLRRDRAETVTAPVDVPWRPIVLIGLALVVFYLVDTAAATWGPVFLDDVFPTPPGLIALASFPYLIASGLVRLAGDRLVARFGPELVLRVGALVACAALVLIVFSPTWQVAVLGFTVLGAGVAVIAPLSFSAAAALAGRDADPTTRQARVDAVIARFNQFKLRRGAVRGGAHRRRRGRQPAPRLRRTDGAGPGPAPTRPRVPPGGAPVTSGARGCSGLDIGVTDHRHLQHPLLPHEPLPSSSATWPGGHREASRQALIRRTQLPPPPALRRCIVFCGPVFLPMISEPVGLLARAGGVVGVVVTVLAVQRLPHLRLEVLVGSLAVLRHAGPP